MNANGSSPSPQREEAASAAPMHGRYSLAEMLREIQVDAEDLSGGDLLDQQRIQDLFRNGSRNDHH